ncbi:MAG: tetratricopeptide repeat protein [Pseudomonadales bacterium]|nr:tetratricopeptide repeat protein [Pseudomonadales bacterium]
MRFCLFILSLVLCAGNSAAQDWSSVTESKYQASAPSLYSKIIEARTLLDTWRGNPENLEGAYSLLDEVLRQDEDFAPAYLEAARLVMNAGYISRNNYQDGSLESAQQYLTHATNLEPEYSDALVVLGFVLKQAGQLSDALSVLDRAERIGTESPWLALNKANVLREQRDFQEALNQYERVVANGVVNKTTYAEALRGVANTNIYLGKIHEANLGYQRLLEFEPESAWNWGNYASFQLFTMGDYNNAIVTAEKTLRMMDYPVGRRTLACALVVRWARQKDIAESLLQEPEDDLSRALQLYPDSQAIIAELSRSRFTRPTVEPFQNWLNQNLSN